MIGTSIAVLISLALLIAYWSIYNSLINARNGIDQTWSNIEVELKRRLDLIANVIEVVKGYADHEKNTLMAVTAARSNAQTASAQQASVAEGQLHSAVRSILALAESYPDLKANKSFLDLQTELATTENRIAEKRNAYNQMVSRYKNLRLTVPQCFIANAHHFEERAFYDLPDDQAAAPIKVSF